MVDVCQASTDGASHPPTAHDARIQADGRAIWNGVSHNPPSFMVRTSLSLS